MEEINWDECADEELLEYIVKLGKKLAKEGPLSYQELKRGCKKKNKLKVISEDLQPQEPLYMEINAAKGFPPGKIYLDRFGTWQNALRLAGFRKHLEDPYKMTTDELADYVAEHTSFSREFAAKMLDGMNQRKWSPRKKKDKKDSSSNSYEISLPAYHFA